ncbi:MAG: RIP metalloprotease RseP [Ignavibacteriales bacterium]|nr:RIP metalloprotease RseP [Ignavibacteriales bacterium]
MEFISTTLYFLITIGVLVFVHELGHFLAAISCGMRADVFALGMGNRVLGWNKITGFTFGKLKDDIELQGNTDYRLAAFPIGGYVKISGMVDESLDTEYQGTEPQPWEYRAKPVWQRMIVISAGVIMNIILAVGIFWGINYVQGDQFMQTTEIGMVIPESPAVKAGLQSGDRILSINEKKIEHWEAIQTAIYFDFLGDDLSVAIERNGVHQTILIPRSDIPDISETTFGIVPTHTEALINEVLFGKPAEKAGLLPNDIIVSINGQKVFNQDHVIKIIRANPEKEVALLIKRGDELKTILVTPSPEGLIGVSVGIRYTGPIVTIQYGLFESFPKGVRQTINATQLFARSIWQLIVGKAEFSKSVGGPVRIAQMATRSAEVGVLSFLAFMALLSISLAVMNILPFPALDGGHLIVLLYEAITRKPLPHIIQIRIQQVGMAILLGFMIFVLYNDIFG